MSRGYKICFAVCVFVIGAFLSAFQYTPPSGGGGGGTPSGPAGGTLAGTYPNPTLAASPSLTGNATASGILQIGDPVSTTPFMNPFGSPSFSYLGFGGEFIGTGLNDMVLTGATAHYTGAAPAAFIVRINATGTPDTIVWAKDNGSFSSPVNITAGSIALGTEGLSIGFGATTGHTAGDYWVIPTASGLLWPATLSESGLSGASSALAGAGAGSVTNGVHAFKVTWATGTGETYSTSAGSVNVVNNATNGKITISGIPQSSSTLAIGANVWATKAGGSTYYLAAFVPKGTTSYTFNTADSGLTNVAPAYFDALTTAGGCIYNEVAGLNFGSCGMQAFDYGVRFPLGGAGRTGGYFFDGFPSGLLGTVGNFLTQITALPNGTTATTQSASDNSTKVSTTAYVDTGLSGKAASNASTTVNGQTCALGSTCTISGTATVSVPYIAVGGTNYGPVFAVTQPPATSWTFANQGSSTATTVNGSVVLDFTPNLGVGNLRAYTRSLPATSGYTVIMGVLSTSYASGPCISDGTKYIKFTTVGAVYQYESWNSTSSISTFPTINKYPTSMNTWYRIQDTGGNRTWSVSPDGVNWVQAEIDSTHTFLTETAVGLCSYTDQVPQTFLTLYSYSASAP